MLLPINIYLCINENELSLDRNSMSHTFSLKWPTHRGQGLGYWKDQRIMGKHISLGSTLLIQLQIVNPFSESQRLELHETIQ